jgi:hypothetical protein
MGCMVSGCHDTTEALRLNPGKPALRRTWTISRTLTTRPAGWAATRR